MVVSLSKDSPSVLQTKVPFSDHATWRSSIHAGEVVFEDSCIGKDLPEVCSKLL